MSAFGNLLLEKKQMGGKIDRKAVGLKMAFGCTTKHGDRSIIACDQYVALVFADVEGIVVCIRRSQRALGGVG